MQKRLITFRLDPADVDWLDQYATSMGVCRTTVVTDLLRALRAQQLQFVASTEPNAFPASPRSAGLSLAGLSDAVIHKIKTKFESLHDRGSGCWVWKDAVDKPVFYWGGKAYPAARFSVALHTGPIPDGMVTRHTCANNLCVRPDHLWTGTPLAQSGAHSHTEARTAIDTLFLGDQSLVSQAFPASHTLKKEST